MAFSFDDSWDNCPEVIRAGTAAFGLYCRCGAWSARNLQDGFVPSEIAAAYGSPEWTRKLVDVGLWEICEGGYRMPHFHDRNESAEQARARRRAAARRQALVRDPALRDAVRGRDKDRCRYCGVRVRWSDRKGARGGTYDHVDPDGPGTFENLVVCCRGCSAAKGDRTPEKAGMILRPVYLDTTQIGSETNPESFPPLASSPNGEEARAREAGRTRASPVENPADIHNRPVGEVLRHPSQSDCPHGDPKGPAACGLCRRGIPPEPAEPP